jgi:hypothetical protein
MCVSTKLTHVGRRGHVIARCTLQAKKEAQLVAESYDEWMQAKDEQAKCVFRTLVAAVLVDFSVRQFAVHRCSRLAAKLLEVNPSSFVQR